LSGFAIEETAMLKLGVIGLGYMGTTHLRAYNRMSDVELTAVASRDERKLAGDFEAVRGNLSRAGERIDLGTARRYSTPEELLSDEGVEAVDLCVPTDLHFPLTKSALRAGKHVLVEKPMALDAGQCAEMLAVARKAGRVLMVAQVLRFWPEYRAARDVVQKGGIGSVREAYFRRRCAVPSWGDWLKDPARSGGGAFDLLIHDFDFVLHLLGRPERVRAWGVEDSGLGIDLLGAQFRFPDGSVASVQGGWHAGQVPFAMEYTITGTTGTLEFHSAHRPPTVYGDGDPLELEFSQEDPFQLELETFVEACRRGVAPALCPPEESALAVSIATGALESRRSGGRWLDL
jgi:predicted dehydrogenase